MASIAEILAKEGIREPRIYLYKEGIFWKAYQHSAYQVVRRRPDFKLRKKYIKSVSCEVISLGFPHKTLESVFSKDEIENVEEKLIRISGKEVDIQAYQQWFDAVSLSEQPVSSPFVHPAPATVLPSVPENILRKIREFPIEQSTPMECMMFLANVRKELTGYGHI